MPRTIPLFVVLVLSACVTKHVGTAIAPTTDLFRISCARAIPPYEKYFDMMRCTVENQSDDWLTFQVAELDPGPGRTVSTPQEIYDLIYARGFAQRMRRHNQNMAMALLLVGGVLATELGGETEAAVGAAAIATSEVLATGRDVGDAIDAAVDADLAYSGNHLMGEDFRVPPGLFVRKSLLIQVRDPRRRNPPKALRICFEEPSRECLDVPLWRRERQRS
jgi:hypothetical protein